MDGSSSNSEESQTETISNHRHPRKPRGSKAKQGSLLFAARYNKFNKAWTKKYECIQPAKNNQYSVQYAARLFLADTRERLM